MRAALIVAILCLTLAATATFAADPPGTIDFSTRATGDWNGLRKNLAEQDGIDFQLSTVADGTKNVKGGLDTANGVTRTMVDFRINIDLKPLVGLAGGNVYMDFQTVQGQNASDHLIGDLQGIDSLDGVPGAENQNRTQLSQLWYQQMLFNDTLAIAFGKQDVNTDFDHVNAAQEFIHQSYGSSATLFTLPTYPDPSIGLSMFFNPRPDWQLQFGVFDGTLANGTPTGELGPAPYFHNSGDVFLIAEIDKSWNTTPSAVSGGANPPASAPAGAPPSSALPGRAGIGAWYSTNSFTRFDGTTATGTGAPYAFIEQTLWQSDPRSLTAFLMYGYADPTISPITQNFGVGLTLTAPIISRPKDILGVGVQAAQLSNEISTTADYEIDYELFYRVQMTPWFYLKPDVQYISNPGGQGTPDALAISLRAQIDF